MSREWGVTCIRFILPLYNPFHLQYSTLECLGQSQGDMILACLLRSPCLCIRWISQMEEKGYTSVPWSWCESFTLIHRESSMWKNSLEKGQPSELYFHVHSVWRITLKEKEEIGSMHQRHIALTPEFNYFSSLPLKFGITVRTRLQSTLHFSPPNILSIVSGIIAGGFAPNLYLSHAQSDNKT